MPRAEALLPEAVTPPMLALPRAAGTVGRLQLSPRGIGSLCASKWPTRAVRVGSVDSSDSMGSCTAASTTVTALTTTISSLQDDDSTSYTSHQERTPASSPLVRGHRSHTGLFALRRPRRVSVTTPSTQPATPHAAAEFIATPTSTAASTPGPTPSPNPSSSGGSGHADRLTRRQRRLQRALAADFALVHAASCQCKKCVEERAGEGVAAA